MHIDPFGSSKRIKKRPALRLCGGGPVQKANPLGVPAPAAAASTRPPTVGAVGRNSPLPDNVWTCALTLHADIFFFMSRTSYSTLRPISEELESVWRVKPVTHRLPAAGAVEPSWQSIYFKCYWLWSKAVQRTLHAG